MTYTSSESEIPTDDPGYRRTYFTDEDTRTFNWTLLVIEVLIVTVGILNLVSATTVQDKSLGLYRTQLLWFGVGCAATGLLLVFHYSFLNRLGYLVYFLTLLTLVAVLFLGRETLGAKRWLHLGPASFQPSEFMKLAFVIGLAKYLASDNVTGGYGFKDLLFPTFLMAIPSLLIMKQPDLGTAIIVMAIFASMMLFVGVKRHVIITLLSLAVVAGPLVYRYGLKPYQRTRILAFLNPASDPKGASYNSIQSMVAVGSGRLVGKGYKKGTQSQRNFIPEHHTDFIFSVYSEEHGFLGSALLIGLYAIFLITGLTVAVQSNDKFALLTSFGICAMFFWQIFINLGMVTGLLPIVGVPLPLMSYGGSSMITSMCGVAILINVANKKFMF